MNEAELILVNDATNCTIYSIRFRNNDDAEIQRFYNKFVGALEYDADLSKLFNILNHIGEVGALERFFRPEGKMNDRVCALPVLRSKLRLYCIRLSDKILVVGNGGAKTTQTYEEDTELRGHVLTLQKFDKLLKEGEKDGSITVTQRTIETDKTFEI